MNELKDIHRKSPFEPGKIVSSDKFEGRKLVIKQIVRYSFHLSDDKIQYFLLYGQKGMGKTSLGKFLIEYLKDVYSMEGIYISNNGNNNLEKFLNLIVESFLNKIPKNKLIDTLKSLFDNIDSLEIKGTKINFKANEYEYSDVLYDFSFTLNKLISEITSQPIFLVIDDIDELVTTKEFLIWFKTFLDTNNINFPLYILFIGDEESFDNFIAEYGLYFYGELKQMDNAETYNFFKKSFESVNIECSDELLHTLTYFSSGFPLLMQEIGDSIFWRCENNVVTKDTIKSALLNIADKLAITQIRPVFDKINKKDYDKILLKIGEKNLYKFNRSDIINDFQEDIVDSFINDLYNEEILIKSRDRYHYLVDITFHGEKKEFEFNDILFFTYFLIIAKYKNL